MDFWFATSGTWINVSTILIGTICGLLLQDRLATRIQRVMTQAIALVCIFVSLNMAGSLSRVKAGSLDGTILALLAMILGGILGEWWQLEKRLEDIGDWLKQKFKGTGKFTDGFVAASLLFCIGPIAIIGSLNNGLTGDNTLLVLKAVMDGMISIPFTTSFGVGVGFSALSILAYQGGISLLAGAIAQVLPDPTNAPQVLLISGIGGLLLLGLGLNLLEVTKINLAAFLPALFLSPIFYAIAIWFS
ncbi:uncharacterized membrane protein, possible Na+ channel or pump [Synechococcus sp. PCC 7502]|uniref:DUF554 domain-containing protein n=1 Tax=Synechococcus sp. PCC 7502 TaxID=1173263 RepID=UPI00029FAF1D|nr:DUF554 domain-containing protein [Synechococcus sp. PCC 7502]AFY74419.1 uncharacterized membrane protein, possible Na+ channel or pump [Synechococcus sp. PCC 7502]